MTKISLFLSLALVAVANAYPYAEDRPRYDGPPQYEPQEFIPREIPHEPLYQGKAHPHQYKEEPPKPYAFDYGVRDDYSGANYGHSETSNGNTIEGSYQVALPDGRIQIVKYVADHKNGFQAQVEYEGEARFPDHKPHEPQYKPHEPQYQPEPPKYKPQRSYKSQPQYKAEGQQQHTLYQEDLVDEVPVYHPEEYKN